MADILALSPAEQAEALALFYRKKARDLKKAELKKAAEASAAAELPVPPVVDAAVLAPAPAGPSCWGCREDQPNQLAHMEPGGCLYQPEEELFVPEEVPAPAEPAEPNALLVALGLVPPARAAHELSFVSLINRELWKKNWHKCFNRAMASDSEVAVGDEGSIGIGYGIRTSLSELIDGKTEAEAIAAVSAAGAVSAQVHGRTALTARGIKDSILAFYELASAPDGTLFGIKQGTKARWVAEKTTGYFHAPPAERAEAPLVSVHQNEPNFFEHRFSFRIVAVVDEAERQMVHHLTTIKKHTVTF